MTYSPTDARNRNKGTLARMRKDQERQQARLEKLAFSDQTIQQAANAVPVAKRRPWWPLLGRSCAR
jgi:hypothetical protein